MGGGGVSGEGDGGFWRDGGRRWLACLLLARVLCGGRVSETVAGIHVVFGVGAHAQGFSHRMRYFATGTVPSDHVGASADGTYLPLGCRTIALHQPLPDWGQSNCVKYLLCDSNT